MTSKLKVKKRMCWENQGSVTASVSVKENISWFMGRVELKTLSSVGKLERRDNPRKMRNGEGQSDKSPVAPMKQKNGCKREPAVSKPELRGQKKEE